MYDTYLVLGGAGLVGTQVCRRLLRNAAPRRLVVASLLQEEAEAACRTLRAEFGERAELIPVSGNLFVPRDLAHVPRARILEDGVLRRRLIAALYDDFETAYRENHLVGLIRDFEPDVVVDCVNTATGLSYQDVFDGAARVREWIREDGYDPAGLADLETFLLSQSVPQLIRHVRMVHRATTEHGVRVYLKVGTTGTGGMGLNIPYTHSEDRPSRKLLAKNEAAFGHTGLLFLMARTPHAPIVKEIKPAAMIGYRAVQVKLARDRHGNRRLFRPKEVLLDAGGRLELREPEERYDAVGELRVPVVDTGENGVFTRGEFAAITALGQMEYVTPEEIARVVELELRGANTGQDCIAALDGSVLGPSYKAGLLRGAALRDLERCEEESGIPSVALGRLGPPELSKLLFEAYLFKHALGTLQAAASDTLDAEALAALLVDSLEPSGVARTAPSIGVPVLLPDGRTLLRGPRINVPEVLGHRASVPLDDEAAVDRWARKGWVDLRPANVQRWQDRFRSMVRTRAALRDAGSAAADIRTYMLDTFEIGDVVAWIFNNEMDGYRIKE